MPAERRRAGGGGGPLWAGLVGLAALAAGLLWLVAGDFTQEQLAQLRATRALYLAHTLKEPLEAEISLGLPLDQLPRAQDLLEHEQARSDALSIELFDPRGRVVFGTDRAFLGDLVAESWLNRAAAAGTQPWFALDPDADVVGLPLVNGFGGVIGQIAIRSRPLALGRDEGWPWPAPLLAAVGLVGVAVALAGGLAWGPRPPEPDFTAAQRAAAEAEQALAEALAEARRRDEDA